MDEVNKAWLKGKLNFYFRYKRKIIEKMIVGKCLNVGCGEHIIKNAVNIDKNAEDLPYESNSFDTVILSDVIEHIKDWETAIKEAIRVSKKKVILTVPAYMWLWSDYDKELGHYRRYIKKDLEKHLDSYLNINYKIVYLFGALLPFIWARKFTSGETPDFPKPIDNLFYIISHLKLPFGSTILLEIKK
jgi:SAM-dependent methyltransferase